MEKTVYRNKLTSKRNKTDGKETTIHMLFPKVNGFSLYLCRKKAFQFYLHLPYSFKRNIERDIMTDKETDRHTTPHYGLIGNRLSIKKRHLPRWLQRMSIFFAPFNRKNIKRFMTDPLIECRIPSIKMDPQQ